MRSHRNIPGRKRAFNKNIENIKLSNLILTKEKKKTICFCLAAKLASE